MSVKDFNSTRVEIRVMNDADLDATTAIDGMHFGVERPEYYRDRLQAPTRGGGINTSLEAELDGVVVGFTMGQLYTGEFGIPEKVAYLDTVGVHAMVVGKGTANMLLDQFCLQMSKLGVSSLYTLADWKDKNLMLFSHRGGFVPWKHLSLELNL